LSGLTYQQFGLTGSLWCSTLLVALAAAISIGLPEVPRAAVGRQ
jgi:hypothetical protein